MWNEKYGTDDPTYTKQIQIMDMESRSVVIRGEGVGLWGSLWLVDANCNIWNGWAMESYSTAQGILCD